MLGSGAGAEQEQEQEQEGEMLGSGAFHPLARAELAGAECLVGYQCVEQRNYCTTLHSQCSVM